MFSLILAPLTLGILHIVTSINRRRRFSYYSKNGFFNRTKCASFIQRVDSCPAVTRLQPSKPKINELTRDTMGSSIQSLLIDSYYSKPHPSPSQITVPVEKVSKKGARKVIWRKWNTLSQREKVLVNNTGTHPHNQLKSILAPFIVDLYFNPPFTHSNIHLDPHKHHGSDHAIRVSFFSAVFAYLYQKYHPHYQVTDRDILLSQFIGAGHDAGRESEGPDVYDLKSYEYTKNALRELGETEVVEQICYSAIVNKDSSDLASKPLVAKCVQNADSMDFSRLLMKDFMQDPDVFEKARGYLDIYSCLILS